MSLRNLAISSVKWTSLSGTLNVAFQILQLVVLSRLLAPADFGLIALANVIRGFAAFYTDCGIGNAVIQRTGVNTAQLSSLYWLNVMFGLAVFLIVIALAPLVAHLYDMPELTGLVSVAAVTLLVSTPGQQFQSLMEKELRFRPLALIEISSGISGTFVAIVAAFQHAGAYSIVYGQLASAGVKTLLLCGIGFRLNRPDLTFRLQEIKGFVSFGLFQVAERSVSFLNFNFDKMLVGYWLGSHALGYYSMAFELMVKPISVAGPIVTRVAFPIFSKVQDDAERLRTAFLNTTAALAAVTFPVYGIMTALAPQIILVLLGPQWTNSVHLLQLLSPLGFFYGLSFPLISLLMSKGRADLGFYLNLVTITVYSLAMWLGASGGVNGIASARLLVTLLVLFPLGFVIRQYVAQIGFREYISAFLPMLACTAISSIVVYWAGNYFALPFSPLFSLIGLATLGGLTYLLLFASFAKMGWTRGMAGA